MGNGLTLLTPVANRSPVSVPLPRFPSLLIKPASSLGNLHREYDVYPCEIGNNAVAGNIGHRRYYSLWFDRHQCSRDSDYFGESYKMHLTPAIGPVRREVERLTGQPAPNAPDRC